MSKYFRSARDVIIRTNRFEEAVKFYESVLGFRGIRHKETLVGFETGNICLYVEKGRKHGPVFEFLTPSIKIAKRKLVAAGCAIVEENPSVPRCYVRDPFGMVFNIGQA